MCIEAIFNNRYIYIYVIQTCVHIYTQRERERDLYVCIDMWKNSARVCVYVYVYIYIDIDIFMYVHVYVYMYIYPGHFVSMPVMDKLLKACAQQLLARFCGEVELVVEDANALGLAQAAAFLHRPDALSMLLEPCKEVVRLPMCPLGFQLSFLKRHAINSCIYRNENEHGVQSKGAADPARFNAR